MTDIVYAEPVRRVACGWTWFDRLGLIAEAAKPAQWVDITASLNLPPLPCKGGGPFTQALKAADKRRTERWELCTRNVADGTRHLFGRYVPTGCCAECGRPL